MVLVKKKEDDHPINQQLLLVREGDAVGTCLWKNTIDFIQILGSVQLYGNDENDRKIKFFCNFICVQLPEKLQDPRFRFYRWKILSCKISFAKSEEFLFSCKISYQQNIFTSFHFSWDSFFHAIFPTTERESTVSLFCVWQLVQSVSGKKNSLSDDGFIQWEKGLNQIVLLFVWPPP